MVTFQTGGWQRQLTVGGIGRCRCREVAEQRRHLREAEARERHRCQDLFWQISRFGQEFRRARVQDLTWPAGMQRALDTAQKVSPEGGGLLLFGPPGIGKTLLCCCLLNTASAQGITALPATLPHLLAEMRASWHADHDGPTEGWLTSRLISTPWVLLDDVGEVGNWGRDKLFSIVNARWMMRHRLVTLATSNLAPKDLVGVLGDRVLSRLVDMCRPVECKGEDRRVARARHGA